MTLHEQIELYISSQKEPKKSDLYALNSLIQKIIPNGKLWFLDGKDEHGKVVSNSNIGYGYQLIPYANGQSKAFYQIGLSANTKGISIYLIGLKDKNYLSHLCGNELGKAKISGYCINFSKLQDIHIPLLENVIKEVLKLQESNNIH
jgi:hypothetical protein